MTPDQIAESVRLAAEGIDALNANRHAMPRGWLPDDVRLIATALLALHAEVERMRPVVEALTAYEARRRTGSGFASWEAVLAAIDSARKGGAE
jgi:hypothetical protein